MSDNPSFAATKQRNGALWDRVRDKPEAFRILTGERPTGALHVGHYFGTLKNRLILQDMGVELFVLIADYQTLTDRDASSKMRENVFQIMLDYLAIGLDPKRCTMFCHSEVAALNQLMLPFLSLISVAELDRNPTVKSEIQQLGDRAINALMYTYPAHQAADILALKGSLVPGGKDQLPHIELTRLIARRFNERYSPKKPTFEPPELLLSEAPMLLGVDGQKMGKSLNNAVFLQMTADETAKVIKKAKTDSERRITYAPESRPEVSNLLLLTSLCSDQSPEEIAEEIGDQGSGALKQRMTEAVNEYFSDVRSRRLEYAKDRHQVMEILKTGNAAARAVAEETLAEVKSAMQMTYY